MIDRKITNVKTILSVYMEDNLMAETFNIGLDR